MESIGWLGLIIIGGLAGWLAGKLMDARYGIILNIILGIAGSVVTAGLLVALHADVPGGRLGFFITGFIGACILIFLAKFARR